MTEGQNLCHHFIVLYMVWGTFLQPTCGFHYFTIADGIVGSSAAEFQEVCGESLSTVACR